MKNIQLEDAIEIIKLDLKNLTDMSELLCDDDVYFLLILDMLITLQDCVSIHNLTETKILQLQTEFNESISKMALTKKDTKLIDDTFSYLKLKITNIYILALKYECYETLANFKKITIKTNDHIIID
jgi:hypothetical protein